MMSFWRLDICPRGRIYITETGKYCTWCFFVLIFFPGDVVAKHLLTYPPGYDSNPGGLIPERFAKMNVFMPNY